MLLSAHGRRTDVWRKSEDFMVVSRISDMLLRLPRRQKRIVALASDGVICAWSAWAALYLRLEQWVPLFGPEGLAVVAAVLIALPIFIRFGLYRTIFRHTGWPAMLSVFRACLLYGAIYSAIFTFLSVPGVPRTVGIIQPALLFLAIGASRALAHYLLGSKYRGILNEEQDAARVVIYGAGASGRQLAEAIDKSGNMRVVGFFDDDRSLHGALVQGYPIFDPATAQQVIAREEIAEVLLAIPSSGRQRRRQIVDLLLSTGVQVRILPGLVDLAVGSVQVSDLRPIQIEDLLGREPVQPHDHLLRLKVAGKVVLVTGGGGSIGSELCRQIVDIGPEALLIVDWSEYALYSIHRELEERCKEAGRPPVRLVPLVASVQDEVRMSAIISTWRPEIIYHAAAYKHVPLVEQNPLEGLKNNVFGTLNIARIALAQDVRDMVLISTDKAVRPTNIMGASKRLAELILQAYAAQETNTCFSMVRFGNVLGSSGSVVPLFREQISAGGPITLTHSEVTRYFMTISEASQLVIQASAMAAGGDVFVLDMGEPVRIYDLAVSMIELSGLHVRDSMRPDGDIEITVSGLRPGEKLYEELLIGDNPVSTPHERILRAHEKMIPADELNAALDRLEVALSSVDATRAIEILKTLVPEYRSSDETVAPPAAPSEPRAAQDRAPAARNLSLGGIAAKPAG
jgi:FlaA1/EpsC-like NDP-sugar epimerase